MELEALGATLEALAEETITQSPEFVRRLAVATLNKMKDYTPPNPGRKVTGGGWGRQAVKKLQERIQEEIVGGDKLPTAIPGNGKMPRPLHVQGKLGWSGYGFVTPRGELGRKKLPYVNVKQFLKRRKIKRKGDVYRGTVGVPPGLYWVRKSEVDAEVQRLKARAGSLIGAWYPAAQTAGVSNLAQFRPGKWRRDGSGKMICKATGAEYQVRGDFGDLLVFHRFMRYFPKYKDAWVQGAAKEIKFWYFKSIGLDDLAKKYAMPANKKRALAARRKAKKR
ncbi:MAG: hypothetical protein IKV82_04845 [Akkermansia sp.]|nr:hypothetical protein [Akkermansia sp.]